MSHKNTLQPHKLYGNIAVLHPNGQTMFYTSLKKANWYKDRNLAKFVDESNKTLQLTFEPKGLGYIGRQEFIVGLKNSCAVCGIEEKLCKVHIVPYSYLSFFPKEKKNHRPDHLVMLCKNCARLYEDVSLTLKKKLAKDYNAPIHGKGLIYDKELRVAKLAAWALLYKKTTMPQEAIEKKMQKVIAYIGFKPNDEGLTALAHAIPQWKYNFKPHAELVMSQIFDYDSFSEMWKEYFVKTMNPQYLPSYLEYLKK